VIRAAAKGAGQLAFARVPGGAHVYRELTRGRFGLGTAATHVDKLARVWPGYVQVWRRLGVELDGADLWTHDAGATPFMPLAAFLLTGRGAAVTNREDRILDRYLEHARAGALAAAWPAAAAPKDRRRVLQGLRWVGSAREALAIVGARVHDAVRPDAVPLASASIDLCHSGGALEHYRRDELVAFLGELWRVLRPGAVASHVFDHRDHLHHADRRLPFLAHLGWSEPAYGALFGHALGFHARLAPAEVQDLFTAAGFERLAVRRLIYDNASGERRWVEHDDHTRAGAPGLARARLAPRVATITEPDLRTAAAHYLYRKPR
jgi:SAM-dependent methyltransferase